MSVALFILKAKCMRRVILSSVACPVVPYFPHYPTNGTIFGEKDYWTQTVFWFSLQLLSETFLILRRIQRDIITGIYCSGPRGGAVGWGTALQTGRSHVRFPMVSLEFFINIILPALGLTQLLTEMSTRNISWGQRWLVHRDDLTTFMCQLSWNLGASTSWNPQSLSRPVMGLLYILPVPEDFLSLFRQMLV